MSTRSPLSDFVRPSNLVRILGICAVLTCVWLSLLFTLQASAAPLAPQSPQFAKSESLGLSDFSAKVTKNKTVLLIWNTGSEAQILGFNLWKRTGKGVWVKMNADLIPAKNTGQLISNQYTQRDSQVKVGKTYRYMLEVVSITGYSAKTDPLAVKIQ